MPFCSKLLDPPSSINPKPPSFPSLISPGEERNLTSDEDPMPDSFFGAALVVVGCAGEADDEECFVGSGAVLVF